MTRLNNYKKEIRITDRLCRDHSCISYDDIKTLSNWLNGLIDIKYNSINESIQRWNSTQNSQTNNNIKINNTSNLVIL